MKNPKSNPAKPENKITYNVFSVVRQVSCWQNKSIANIAITPIKIPIPNPETKSLNKPMKTIGVGNI